MGKRLRNQVTCLEFVTSLIQTLMVVFWIDMLILQVHLFALVSFLMILALMPLHLYRIYELGNRALGRGYAIRQCVVYVVLSPVFLIGPVVMPLVLRSDVKKAWSAMRRSNEASAARRSSASK